MLLKSSKSLIKTCNNHISFLIKQLESRASLSPGVNTVNCSAMMTKVVPEDVLHGNDGEIEKNISQHS